MAPVRFLVFWWKVYRAWWYISGMENDAAELLAEWLDANASRRIRSIARTNRVWVVSLSETDENGCEQVYTTSTQDTLAGAFRTVVMIAGYGGG